MLLQPAGRRLGRSVRRASDPIAGDIGRAAAAGHASRSPRRRGPHDLAAVRRRVRHRLPDRLLRRRVPVVPAGASSNATSSSRATASSRSASPRRRSSASRSAAGSSRADGADRRARRRDQLPRLGCADRLDPRARRGRRRRPSRRLAHRRGRRDRGGPREPDGASVAEPVETGPDLADAPRQDRARAATATLRHRPRTCGTSRRPPGSSNLFANIAARSSRCTPTGARSDAGGDRASPRGSAAPASSLGALGEPRSRPAFGVGRTIVVGRGPGRPGRGSSCRSRRRSIAVAASSAFVLRSVSICDIDLQHQPGQLPPGDHAGADAGPDERHDALHRLGHDPDRVAARRGLSEDDRRRTRRSGSARSSAFFPFLFVLFSPVPSIDLDARTDRGRPRLERRPRPPGRASGTRTPRSRATSIARS